MFPGVDPEIGADDAKRVARELAEATPPKLRLAFAKTFCAVVIEHYWNAAHARRGRVLRAAPPTSRTLNRAALDSAGDLGASAARLSVDEAAYVIGSTYAAMLPSDYRATHGVYYTPPLVVDRLLDQVQKAGVDWSTAHILDPACGGGAFLGPVAARIIRAMKDCDRRVVVRNVAARLRGYEIDAFAAWMSQVFLEATLHTMLDGAGAELPRAIDVCDSLSRHADDASFDLVIGNPPYGRVTLAPEQREVFQRSLYGHANLYGIFLDLAIRLARPRAVIGYVTPTSFLSGEYFKRLRALLAAEARPVCVDFVEARSGVFEDVQQETLLAVYQRGAEIEPPHVHFVDVQDHAISVRAAGAAALPNRSEDPWLLPRSVERISLAARLRAMPQRLADWGYGVSTGPLVWNRYKSRMRQKPDACTVPLIWAEAISADGTFVFRAARRNHAPYFAVLDPSADKWLLVTRPCVLLQRTTSKEQPRRLIAAELPPSFIKEHGSVTVENHLNMLVPIVDEPKVDTATLAAFLNTAAADAAFRCINGSVAVSAYELKAMPLPAPDAVCELTLALRKGGSRKTIETLSEKLYALP